jgi:hypothetical protein
LCSSRETETPGKSRSTRNAENLSPSIFAITRNRSAHFALEIHIFVPFSTNLSPRRSARVVAESASLPEFGSLSAYAPIHSPLVRRGRYWAFCASVPNRESPT